MAGEVAFPLHMVPPLERFLRVVLAMADVPYLWGGKSPGRGLDCSGTVTLGLWLAGGPDWRATHDCDRLWAACEYVEETEAQPGDLAFYGRRKPDGALDCTHVMVLLPGGRVWGATGGDSTTTSRAIAEAKGARVKAKPLVRYRQDFVGFRRLPL